MVIVPSGIETFLSKQVSERLMEKEYGNKPKTDENESPNSPIVKRDILGKGVQNDT